MLSHPCGTCRYRQVRCDGVRPSCSQCRAIGFACSGYAASSSAGAYTGDGRSILSRLHPDTMRDPLEGIPVYDPVPDMYNEAQIVFDGVHYYNEQVSGDLISVGAHFNPYRIPLSRIDKIPRIYINLVVTTATLHRDMQQDPACARSPTAIQRGNKLLEFRIRAIKEVNNLLSRKDTQTSDSTLMCVVCLLLSTMQMSAYSEWRPHLEGARRIIQMRGGLRAIIRENVHLKPLLAFFVAIDVMAATTAPSTHGDMYRATTMALHYWEVEQSFFQSILAISAPCPEELFQALIMVNYLRSASGRPHLASRRRAGTCMVLEKLVSFSAPRWAKRMEGFAGWKASGDGVDFVTPRPRQGEADTPSSSSGSTPSRTTTPVLSVTPQSLAPGSSPLTPRSSSGTLETDLWLHIGIVYQSAITLYAIRTLILELSEEKGFLRTGMTQNFDVNDVRQESRKALAEAIAPLYSDSENAHQFGKLVYFPMFVCGMEATDDETALRDFVVHGLETVGRACGTLGPISAADELRGYWAACASVGRQVTWDEYFEGRPDFIFGF